MARNAGAPESYICGVDSVDRGRATGMEVSLPLLATCVLRVAKKPSCRSLKLARFGAWRWPHGATVALMGRGRALEVILSADDVSGDLAERYGYVNRSLPDADLDGFVDALATRIALSTTDNHGYQAPSRHASLPPDIEIESG